MKINPAVTERLTLSRARLRLAMAEMAAPPSQAPGAGARPSGPGWRARLAQGPATRLLLLELGLAWWARQPLRLLLPLAAQAAQAVLGPTAQRHPVGLVLSAAAVGAALVQARPWQWLSATALLASLLRRLRPAVARPTRAPSLARPNAPPTAAMRGPAR